MANGKAFGYDDILVEVGFQGEREMEFLKKVVSIIMDSEKIPKE